MSVVVPSYKRPSDLRRCLSALKLQARPADEVVVVVRSGDTETLDVVSEFCNGLSGLRSVLVNEPGLVAAINRGLDCATGDFMVLTDDDAEAFPDWLERIEASFLSDSAIGAVGGRDWIQGTVLSDPPTVDRVGCLTWWGGQYGNHHCRLRGHRQKVDFLKGVNFAIRKSALQSYRIDTFLRGSGAQACTEIDLCMHMKNKGFEIVFDDQILVKHFASERPASDYRADSVEVGTNVRFNKHYTIAKHFNLYFSLMHLWNDLTFGRRPGPGLLACVKWTIKGDTGNFRLLLDQSALVFAAFRAGRRARQMA
jgi:glycosyltransferase involved in cell wall biosynthesis